MPLGIVTQLGSSLGGHDEAPFTGKIAEGHVLSCFGARIGNLRGYNLLGMISIVGSSKANLGKLKGPISVEWGIGPSCLHDKPLQQEA